jgi:hypothetical protein
MEAVHSFQKFVYIHKPHGIMSQKAAILNLNVVICDYLYYEWKQLNAALEKTLLWRCVVISDCGFQQNVS